MGRIFGFRVSKDDTEKNIKKKEVTETLFHIIVERSVDIFTDILMFINIENGEIQKFNSEEEFYICILESKKIKLLFSIKSINYNNEEHLLLYLDKNCFGYYNELYNCDIVQNENFYLIYNYGFFRSSVDLYQKYFDSETLVETIMDEVMLCGSSLYE